MWRVKGHELRNASGLQKLERNIYFAQNAVLDTQDTMMGAGGLWKQGSGLPTKGLQEGIQSLLTP